MIRTLRYVKHNNRPIFIKALKNINVHCTVDDSRMVATVQTQKQRLPIKILYTCI